MEKTSPQDNKVWIYFFVMKHSSKTALGPKNPHNVRSIKIWSLKITCTPVDMNVWNRLNLYL